MTSVESKVTVAELDTLLAEFLETEAEKEELAKQVTEKNKVLMGIRARMTAHMKELGREEYDSPLAKCEIKQTWTVNLPQGQDKVLFFDYLRERGMFDQMATVNSASLNALYKKEWAEAQAKGPEEAMVFTMPGIGAPKVFEDTKIKPKKK